MSQHSGKQEVAKPSVTKVHSRTCVTRGDDSPARPHQSGRIANASNCQKPRVQRRKTRRERNHAKFGKSAPDRILEQRRSDCAFQKVQIHQRCPKPASATALKGTCLSNSVITQNRLTQPLGMFNREVKSADIRRLLEQDHNLTEMAPHKSPLQKDFLEDRGGALEALDEKVTGDMNSNMEEVTEQSVSEFQGIGSSGERQLNEKQLLPSITKPGARIHSMIRSTCHTQSPTPACPTQDTTTGQSLASLSTSDMESMCQDKAPPCKSVQDDKENTPLTLRLLGHQSVPVKEVAEKLLKILYPPAAFAARSLVNETRQSILTILLDRYGKVPDVSAPTVCRRLDYSSTPSVQEGGCVSVHSSDSQYSCERGLGWKDEGLNHSEKRRKLKSLVEAPQASSSSSNSALQRTVFPRNWRFAFCCNCVSQFQLVAYRSHFSYTWKPEANTAQSRTREMNLFEELEIHGQHKQNALSPQASGLPPGSIVYPRSVFPGGNDHIALDLDCPHLCVSRREPGSREISKRCLLPLSPQNAIWNKKSSLEKNADTISHAFERSKVKPYSHSFISDDSIPTGYAKVNQNICPPNSVFPLYYQGLRRPMSCDSKEHRNQTMRVGPHQQVLKRCLESQAHDIYSCQVSQERFDNPTSFDRFSSIWSSGNKSRERESISKSINLIKQIAEVPFVECQMTDRETCHSQGLQIKPIFLQQHSTLQHLAKTYLHGPERKVCTCGAAFSVHRSDIQRAQRQDQLHVVETQACAQSTLPSDVGCHIRDHTCMVTSGSRSSSAGNGAFPFNCTDHGAQACLNTGSNLHTVRHKGCPAQTCQIPMSFFPPSEVLEQSLDLNPHTYTDSVRPFLERSSPEDWVFPRMKLY